MNTFTYEEEGLFIAIISYPYYVDGADLFKTVFPYFFSEHVNHLKRLSRDVDEDLYVPVGYRLIGGQGLAVLSLIDDYSFASRVFNQAHIDNFEEDRIKTVESYSSSEGGKEICLPQYNKVSQCKTIALTGSYEMENKETGKSLRTVWKEIFKIDDQRIKVKGKYTTYKTYKEAPYIGILRLKINSHFLIGKGLEFTRTIKQKINEISLNEGVTFIVVDSYNNDDLIVLIFSAAMIKIVNFAEQIKKISLPIDKGQGPKEERPVFSSIHMCYGIHTDCQTNTREDESLFVNFLIEPLPGCKDSLIKIIPDIANQIGHVDQVKKSFDGKYLGCTVTGGGLLHYRLKISELDVIYEITKRLEFKRYVKRVKLTMSNESTCSSTDYELEGSNDPIIDCDEFLKLKRNLHTSEISKTVRERTLSLIHQYNLLGSNEINRFYLESLKDSILKINKIISDFKEEESPIYLLNNELNNEVSSLRSAIADRVINGVSIVPVLEYNCGVQQLLHAFGFAYNHLFNFFDEDNSVGQYSFIVGDSKECTNRTHVELNINHFIYPDIFAITILKEILNNSYSFFRLGTENENIDNKNKLSRVEVYQYSEFFKQIDNPLITGCIIEKIVNELIKQYHDQVYKCVIDLLREHHIVKYLLSDVVVFVTTFQADYSLMWNSYLRVFLQESSIYTTEGKVMMKPYAFIILRLLLVGRVMFKDGTDSLTEKNSEDFHFKQKTEDSYDHLIASLQLACMPKLIESSKIIYEQLDVLGFNEFIRSYASAWVSKIFDETELKKDDKEVDFLAWQNKVDTMKNSIINNNSIPFIQDLDEKDNGETFPRRMAFSLLTLFGAFARVVDEYAVNGTPGKPIKSVIRDRSDGNISKIDDGVLGLLAGIISDPIGGYIIPTQEGRKKYFAYTTCFYRTLWDWSYIAQAKTVRK